MVCFLLERDRKWKLDFVFVVRPVGVWRLTTLTTLCDVTNEENTCGLNYESTCHIKKHTLVIFFVAIMLPVEVYFVVIEGVLGVMLAVVAIIAIAVNHSVMARVTNTRDNTGWPGSRPTTCINSIQPQYKALLLQVWVLRSLVHCQDT